MTTNKIRIYACGGAGLNIASKYLNAVDYAAEVSAELDICFIDLSRSNLIGKNIPENKQYIFKGVDGSGQNRGANIEMVESHSEDILNKFPPSDILNIFVHSASGGSGSVIGPILTRELKKLGYPTISMVIGSKNTSQETWNTGKTLATYDAISKLTGSSTILYYITNMSTNNTGVKNEAGVQLSPRQVSDRFIESGLARLRLLYSGVNAELDTSDLKNWLSCFDKLVDTPTIGSLNITTKRSDLIEIEKVISVATLTSPDIEAPIEPPVYYQTSGKLPIVAVAGVEGKSFNIINDEPIDFAISFDHLKPVFAELISKAEEIDKDLKSVTKMNTKFEVSKADTTKGGGGMVI